MSNSALTTGKIYTLLDPRDGSVFYIGQTTQTLKERRRQHLRRNTNPGVWTWIQELKKHGMEPNIQQVAEVPIAELDAAEKRAITDHLRRGGVLLNAEHHPDPHGEANFRAIFRPGTVDQETRARRARSIGRRTRRFSAAVAVMCVVLGVGGTMMGSPLRSVLLVLVFVAIGVAYIMPIAHIDTGHEEPAFSWITMPPSLVGMSFMTTASIADSDLSWYLVAASFLLIGTGFRVFITCANAIAIRRQSPGYVDVAKESDCYLFDHIWKYTGLATVTVGTASVAVFGRLSKKPELMVGWLEIAAAIAIAIAGLVSYRHVLSNMPIEVRTFKGAMVGSLLAGNGLGLTVTLSVHCYFYVDDPRGWLIVVFFFLLTIISYYGTVSEVRSDGRDKAIENMKQKGASSSAQIESAVSDA